MLQLPLGSFAVQLVAVIPAAAGGPVRDVARWTCKATEARNTGPSEIRTGHFPGPSLPSQ